ncbi:MAG: hypothetical protein ACD_45C00457G0003 [uncultured bacterium]|nr:MAG: hypothetical protein ACD_45C00457G0003 [uncultured bacterium]
MGTANLIAVEVAYARPDRQRIVSVWVPAGSTIEMVIHQSGILAIFPEIDLTKQKIGIFCQLKELTDKVKEGDRVEIYRALLIDPKEARRKRASKN